MFVLTTCESSCCLGFEGQILGFCLAVKTLALALALRVKLLLKTQSLKYRRFVTRTASVWWILSDLQISTSSTQGKTRERDTYVLQVVYYLICTRNSIGCTLF